MKLTDILNEIIINKPTTGLFHNIVKDFYETNKSLASDLVRGYENKDFINLYNKIIDKYKIFYNNYNKNLIGSFNDFKDWLEGIRHETLPMHNSGSFYTALLDDGWLYDVGIKLGLSNEQIDNIIEKYYP